MDFVMRSVHRRAPFSSSSDANHTCALPNPLVETPTDPVAGGFTFHSLGTIISGCAAGFAILSILILMIRHATHFSKPDEQLKILRICLLIPISAIIQFIGQVVPASYFYIIPWADMMQSLALGNFFLLLLQFISPHDHQRDLFFSGLEVPARRKGRAPRDGMKWYRRKWVAVFQYPVIQFVVAIGTDITQSPHFNIYCQDSNKPYFAHLWLNLIHVISNITAVIACLRFYKVLKVELAGHRPLSKLFAFKLLVGLNILMNIIFWILNGINPSPLTPSSTMNQADVSVGIPAMVNCLILVPFSVFFHYAYSVGPYIIDQHPGSERGDPRYLHYQGGFLGIRAFLGMVNPSEILGALAFMFTMRRRRTSNAKRNVSGRGYDTVTSHESPDTVQAHEMSSRDQRRMDKYDRSHHAPRYDQRRRENAPYGWANQANGNGVQYYVDSNGR